MQQRTLIPLAVATVAVVAVAGWLVTRQDKPATAIASAGPLYPGLAASIDKAARIEFSQGGQSVTVTRKNGAWTVDQRHGYRADRDLVKSTVVGLAEAKIEEPRTSQPDLYPRIEVEDPGKKGAKSRHLSVKDADGKVLADLILGKENFRSALSRQHAYYVRRTGEAQSWLIDTPMEVPSAESIRWIDRALPKLERPRMMAMSVTQADGTTTVSMKRGKPEDADYSVTGLPDGAKVNQQAVNAMAGAVNLFSIDDVEPFDPARFAQGTTAVYKTFDGVVVTIRQVKDGDSRWLHFETSFDPATAQAFAKDSKAPGLLPVKDAEAKAKEWQDLYGAWSYKVADAMGDEFARKPDDFVEKPKETSPSK